MATFTNTSDEALTIPRFGINVAPGDSFDIEDEVDADSLRANPNLTASDSPAAPAWSSSVTDPTGDQPA